MKLKLLFFPFLLLILFGCSSNDPVVEEEEIEKEPVKEEEKEEVPNYLWEEKIFSEENLHFGSNNSDTRGEGVIELNSGRILMKKVTLPEMKENEDIAVRMKLTSSGDPWDRTGSLFMSASPVSFAEIKESQLSLTDLGKETGYMIDLDGQYSPALELIHFCTPFGVGYFNYITINNNYGISAWEDDVQWERNINELKPILGKEFWVGVFIDTWSGNGKGFNIDLAITAEAKEQADSFDDQVVIPILNTIRYIGGQSYYDGFAEKDLEIDVVLDEPLTDVQLYYTVSGHGGHAGGDEFKQCPNLVGCDGQEILNFLPWRTDCKTFRAYNPSSYKDETNNIWSSDLSRSSWCPGSQIDPKIAELGALTAGGHTFKVQIDGAQPSEGDKLNFWCVSMYLVGTKVDQ